MSNLTQIEKSRFCPSPTGYMHLGNARTALFNALFAKGAKGIFLLRIEDTDKTRSSDEYAAIMQEDLRWLGLEWQEGPGVEGKHAPYWQSQRQSIYDQYYRQLESADLVYPCFCSDEQLALTRKVQLASGQPPRYPGTCKALTKEKIQEKFSQGLKATLRFKVPKDKTVEFEDLVKGMQRFNTDAIGDFIIRRADDTASFIYCNAIDDSLMGVTHALRGEDHLTNTPRQLLLLKALNLRAPQYGHISMIVGKDGSPLSKRHGSRSIKELREEGFLPEALLNYLARLGHYYECSDYMDYQTLAERFSLKSFSGAPAKFDLDQLLYWQKTAVNQISDEKFWLWIGEEVHSFVPQNLKSLFITTIRPNVVFPKDALHWAQILFSPALNYSAEAQQVLKSAGMDFFAIAIELSDQFGHDFKILSQALQQRVGVSGKALFQPLRVALTSELHGPHMQEVVEMIGVANVKLRLQQAVKSSQ